MPSLLDDHIEPTDKASVDLSVVIPVYNSAQTLPTLVRRLLDVLNRMGKRFELIFVDDGSEDDSWEVLKGLQEAHAENIGAIQLMRNYGQDNAIMCGFRHTRGQYIVTMDDDLQHPPEEIPRLLEAIQAKGLDLVYGCYKEKKHSVWRNTGSFLVNSFYKLVFKSPITTTSFRILKRELLVSIFSYSLNFTFIDGLLAWNTQRIGEVTIEHHERFGGRSSYSVGKLAISALNIFTNFSLLPLQLTSACGFLVAASGFVTALYYFIQYLLVRTPVPGYASIIIAVLVLGGLQLLALGIMGEYLGRLHLNVNRKPQYTERCVLKARPTATEIVQTACQELARA